jgi:hypothetical protein
MKIATILPVSYLKLDEFVDYHMCLAHMMGIKDYWDHFEKMAKRGDHVLMDNGAAENGVPLPIEQILGIAEASGVTEITLPDHIRDRDKTLDAHAAAAEIATSYDVKLMGIPQGRSQKQWTECARIMLSCKSYYGIEAIGISKYQHGIWDSRLDAINSVRGLIDSDMEIHLLGCYGDDPTEAYRVEQALPGRVRGIDSGISAIYAQNGQDLIGGYVDRAKPGHHLDFTKTPEFRLLVKNINTWEDLVRYGEKR